MRRSGREGRGDFLFAWTLGIAFQYFTVVPMGGEGKVKGIWTAIKVDTASIVAFPDADRPSTAGSSRTGSRRRWTTGDARADGELIDVHTRGVPGSGSGRLSDELVAFLQGGLAIVVATRDDELRPEVARGWGLEVGADGRTATLCIGAPPGSPTRANLEANGALAVTCSRPSTYRTVQLKGTATELREPSEGQLGVVRRHLEAFVEEVGTVGVRPEGARTFLGGELVSVGLDVRELYDQTPGPQAGERL